MNRQPSLPNMQRDWIEDAEDAQDSSKSCRTYRQCFLDFDVNAELKGEGEDEFGSKFNAFPPLCRQLSLSGDDFDEADFSVPQGEHPDEITLDPSVSAANLRRRGSVPSKAQPPHAQPNAQRKFERPRSPPARDHTAGAIQPPQTPLPGGPSNSGLRSIPAESNLDQRVPPCPNPQQQTKSSVGNSLPPPPMPMDIQTNVNKPAADLPNNDSSSSLEHEPPIGFFTAKAAESLQNGPGLSMKAPAFNPHLESPSIRKTAGVDHTKTKPIGRDAVGPPTPVAVPKANFVNPQIDKARRLGMPGGGSSPLQNRGSYKPPQMKRPADGNGARSALGDVTATTNNVAALESTDAKRQKVKGDCQSVDNGEGMLNI